MLCLECPNCVLRLLEEGYATLYFNSQATLLTWKKHGCHLLCRYLIQLMNLSCKSWVRGVCHSPLINAVSLCPGNVSISLTKLRIWISVLSPRISCKPLVLSFLFTCLLPVKLSRCLIHSHKALTKTLSADNVQDQTRQPGRRFICLHPLLTWETITQHPWTFNPRPESVNTKSFVKIIWLIRRLSGTDHVTGCGHVTVVISHVMKRKRLQVPKQSHKRELHCQGNNTKRMTKMKANIATTLSIISHWNDYWGR